MLKRDPDQYAKGRAMFDHILDSFVVRQLTHDESVAIVNPDPIKPNLSQKTKISREIWEKYQQDLIERLNRKKNAGE
jgi:predicted translin family RNA/ssDNA-binding protein